MNDQPNVPPYAPGTAGPTRPVPGVGPAGHPPQTPPGPPIEPPRQSGTNPFAIVALLMGITTPCSGGLLGVVFGIVALVDIRRTGQKGRGLAIWGLVTTGLWFLALVVLVIIAIITDTESQSG